MALLRVTAVLATARLLSAAVVRPKRGFVGVSGCTGNGPDCPDAQLLSAAGWYYSYNVVDNYGLGGSRFVPMNWCISSENQTVPSYVNKTYFLGFNEPNNAHNCNKPAETIAEAWGAIMAKWGSTSKLVSPATAGNGVPFFDEFFADCKTLYGASGCKLSYVAVHDYSCNASNTLAYLQQINQRYGLPVWLTEFSCGDGADGRPTSDHLAYMKEVVPLLDAAPFVYRYAWMSARDTKGLRGLVEAGPNGSPQLTVLGQLYQTL